MMKKKVSSFLAGAAAAAMLLGLATTAGAQERTVSHSSVNVSVLGQTQIRTGDSFTGKNGAEIPSTLTYSDEKGGITTYVALREIARTLNADVYWDSATRTAHLGEPLPSDAQITTGSAASLPAALAATPEYGLLRGQFTEVRPLDAQKRRDPIALLDNAAFSSVSGFTNQRYYIFPEYGDYVEITVTNHGAPVSVNVAAPRYVSTGWPGSDEQFTPVRLETGKTITRAFSAASDRSYAQSFLWLTVEAIGSGASEQPLTDITVHITQYKTAN